MKSDSANRRLAVKVPCPLQVSHAVGHCLVMKLRAPVRTDFNRCLFLVIITFGQVRPRKQTKAERPQMDANAIALLDIFERKMRLEIPMFQRQYVWGKEHQWEPLWEDISRKFTEFIEDRRDAPVHFLGAMVLDQKQTHVGRVERRSVIDGQQRLTTLQIFLVAFRDFCREESLEEFAEECEKYTLNSGRMAEPEVEKFKVWPTLSDRPQFMDVLTAGSKSSLEKIHPLTRRPYARRFNPRPRMVEAYLFFHEQISAYFKGMSDEPPVGDDIAMEHRVEACFEALKTALKVVAIDLGDGDDAQVIFETLNARGEPLLPADLLRNYIFLRAARHGEQQEQLYERYWSTFDDPFWREEVTQGRLRRPRSDLFIQHYLTSKQARDIPIKHLFVEYKHWVEREKPFSSVEQELSELARQRDHFRTLSVSHESPLLGELAHFLNLFDVSTAYPPLLAMLDLGAGDVDMSETADMLESYFVRRAICGNETKAYNRIFMGLTRAIRTKGASAEVVREYLTSLKSATDVWPSDDAVSDAWMSSSAYHSLNNLRLTHVLWRISETYRSSKSENVSTNAPLTVEHIMPQGWVPHWPLPDGSTGVEHAWFAKEETPGVAQSRRRNELVQTFGNLTLITGSLNSSMKNSAWATKRDAILTHSVSPINGVLNRFDSWDESTIETRGRELLGRALKLWSRG
ncbi:DUF262 domain-containing protein [Paraburkholderia phytofirmans]|uniref:DUF262 domain-containing protein n=1 Tax=Paraburkholderia phytofirmans TaxID=261302 RepID=UPI0038B7C111